MFQKNLEAIKIKNPKLAEKLEKIDINSINDVEVFEAESKDLIISYKNIALHSTIDPVREARSIWNKTIKQELKKNDIQLIFGLGLGYLFKRAYVSAESKILIIEPFIEVIRFVLEYVDLSSELADSRVFITDNADDIYEKLNKEFILGDKLEFLFLNQYAASNKELLQDLTSKSFEIIESRGKNYTTIFKLNFAWVKNFISNIVNFNQARPLGYIENKFSEKTALIVAAGPSLANDLELIKANQDKFVTIVVGKAFKTVVAEGIIPDFTVFADPWLFSEQFDGEEESLKKTNLILLSKSDDEIFKNYNSKSKILFFTNTDSMNKVFNEDESQNLGFYKSGSSVSIIAYYAAKALGFEKIAFSGLDLAFINDKLYADGRTLDVLPELVKDFFDRTKTTVKDINGNYIPSRSDYAWFIRQFNEIFTEEINLGRVINTSMKGAFIEGMEYMEFSEFVKTLSEAKPNVDDIVSDIYSKTKNDWEKLLRSVYPKIIQAKEELEYINSASIKLNKEFEKIYNELTAFGKADYLLSDYEELTNKSIEVRNKIVSNLFLSILMQRDIWNYTQNYVTKVVFLSKEEMLKNYELDKEFYASAIENIKNLDFYLTEAIEKIEEKHGITTK